MQNCINAVKSLKKIDKTVTWDVWVKIYVLFRRGKGQVYFYLHCYSMLCHQRIFEKALKTDFVIIASSFYSNPLIGWVIFKDIKNPIRYWHFLCKSNFYQIYYESQIYFSSQWTNLYRDFIPTIQSLSLSYFNVYISHDIR